MSGALQPLGDEIVGASPLQPPSQPKATLADLRFCALLGEAAWSELPEAVRNRFSKRLAPGEMAIYRGAVTTTKLSFAGRVLSFLTRAIGAPLPLSNGATGPALVAVTEDASLGGQSWTRIFSRPGRAPQAIHSTKRFRGNTGLEEYVGYGIGMALKVTVEDSALVFRSARYFLELGPWRLSIPRALEPGRMQITHRDETGGRFSFQLTLDHPLLGRMLYQLAQFSDA